MQGSWRTTILGWLVLMGSVCAAGRALLDNSPRTTVDIESIVTAAAGVGLIAARDNKVSSEKAGAK